MPRTAPSLTGDPTAIDFICRLIDSTNDIRSISFTTFDGVVPSAADLETLTAALGAASNANVFEVQIKQRWQNVAISTDAIDQAHQSVYDNIGINFKDTSANLQQTVYIPAPLATLISSQDQVLNSNIIYTNFRDAADAVLGGGFVPVHTRWTERREKNDIGPV